MFSTNFSKCPHFDTNIESNLRINNLEAGHQAIINELKSMRNNDERFSAALEKHMGDEEVHHKNTIDSMNKMVEVVESLSDEQKLYREERAQREIDKEKRQGMRDKVITSVITALSIALTFWLLDVVTNLEKVNKAIGVE